MFRLLLRCALQGLAVALFFDLASLCRAIGQKVCLYLGVDAGHHPFFAEKVNRRRLFRLDKKCVWLLTFTQVVWGYSR